MSLALPLSAMAISGTPVSAVSTGHTGFFTSAEQGVTVGFDSAGTTASITRDEAGLYVVSALPGGWTALIGAPQLAALTPGLYLDAEEYIGGNRDNPVLQVEGYGHSCNQVTGRFQVDEIETDMAGVITRFAARFEQHCEGQEPALLGAIAVNSSLPAYGHSIDHTSLTFSGIHLHGPSFQEIVVTNTGLSPLPFHGATITGRDAASFDLVDNCGTSTIAPGDSCTIGVNARPVDNHVRATLTIHDAFTDWGVFYLGGQRIPLEATSDLPAGGETHLITPVRILDTRQPADLTGGAKLGTFPLAVPVTGKFGIPTAATGLLINVTVTQPTAAGYLTLSIGGSGQQIVSNLNFGAGETVANFAAVSLGDFGFVYVANSTGQTHVVIDVFGWVGPADEHGVGSVIDVLPSPARVLDTRPGPGKPATPLAAGESRKITFAGLPSVASGSAAVLVNLTVVKPTKSTYLTAYPASEPRPAASNINVAAGQTRANLTLVKLDATGAARFYNANGSTPLVIDVIGVFVAPGSDNLGRIEMVEPWRIIDTRSGAPLDAGSTRYASYLSAATDDLVTDQARYALVNATATRGTTAGYLTLQDPSVTPTSVFSNLNWTGPTVPNAAVIPTFGDVDIVNHSSGTVHVLLDLQAIIT